MSYPCPDCELTFSKTTARNHHRWSQHSEIPPIILDGKQYGVEREGNKLLCPVEQCGRSYTSREAFMKHIKAGHGQSSPVGSSQQNILGQQLFLTSECKASVTSGQEGRGEFPPPTVSSFASGDGHRDPLPPPEDVSICQGNTTLEVAITGGSGLRQMGGNRFVERSCPGIPGASNVDSENFSCLPDVESTIPRSMVADQPVDGKESIDNGAKGKQSVNLLPEDDSMKRAEVLDRLGLCLHAELLVLVCQRCEIAVCSEAALGHAKNQHGVTTSKQEKKAFNEFCEEQGVYERPELVPIPLPGGPPMRGIAAPVPGYSCRADPLNCRYSVRNFQTLLTHARLRHGQGLAHNTDREETMVQTIFQGVGRRYFEVDVTATAGSDFDMRDYLRLQFLPSVKSDHILVASSDRDRPPLLKITMWDEFHEEIRKDAEQRKAAWRIKQKHSPTEHEGILNSLDKVVREHHSRAKEFLKGTSHAFTVAKVLLNGPGFSHEQSKFFRFISGDNDLYLAFFVQMIRAMVRKERGHEFKMQFAYTETQRKSLHSLVERLAKDAIAQSQDSQAEAVLAYQTFCWSLVYSPESKKLGAWDNPIRRFIWLMALHSDGSFMDATSLTPLLAKLKYFCRLVTLYEALAVESAEHETEDTIDRVGRLHNLALKLGTPSTFNMVWELQQVASALVYSQVQDPNVFVDPHYTWISIGTETLHLDRLRNGMARLIQETKTAFLHLSQQDDWPDTSELHVIDDLGKTDRGYSFLEEAPFTNRRYAFFMSSVQKWQLGSFSRNGQWNWDRTAIKEFLRTSDQMWGNVIYALFVGTQLSTRVTQFLQIQLRNADRPRNLIFQGNEAMLLGRYSKTTNAKGRDNCIPAFLAELLRDLLLVLLGSGQRETQAILAGIIYGEESRSLYRTYLCVENGIRITSEAFYDTVKRRNQDLFQCAWGASDFRQGMITLGREFISPDETFPTCANELLAEAADHSTEVDLAHYGIVHGALPRLSNGSLAQHRWLAKEWSSLLGMGPHKPPEPVRIRGTIAQSQKLLDPRELAVQVSDMVADALMSKLAAIGLTSDNIKKLATLGGGPSSPIPGDLLQEARTASSDIPSTSPSGDSFCTSRSYETSPMQLIRQRKRAAVPEVSTSEGATVSWKRVRLNEVDCEKEDVLIDQESQVDRSSPMPSASPSHSTESVLVENIWHHGEDDLLRENIRGAIRYLLQDPTAREKSRSQMEAVLLIMRKRQDGLITMRTGGGKSMLWLIPPLLDPEARFIVVCPFTVLLDQQSELARRYGLRAVAYGVEDIPRDVQILFVQVEHVGHQKFCNTLTEGAPRFTAMFVDEHHDMLSCPPDREVSWKRLARWASDQEMPLYLLSATVPPTLQQRLLDPYNMKLENTAVIRSSTNRQEIGLHTISMRGETGLRSLVHSLATRLKERERMLIFFNSCQEAERFSAQNRCPVFHSKLPEAHHSKEHNMRLWENGASKMMACTSAFGAGVDKPHVRFVVIHLPKYNLMSLLQATGRAGRDGIESHVFFTTTGKAGPPSLSCRAEADLQWQLDQLLHGDKCKVYQAMEYMDGKDMARECKQIPNQVHCDVCLPDGEVHNFAQRAAKEDRA